MYKTDIFKWQEEIQTFDFDYDYDYFVNKTEIPNFSTTRFMDMFKKCKNSKQKIYALNHLTYMYQSLSYQLAYNKYQPHKFTKFISSYPQPREIYAPAFIDRILHHHLVDFMMPHVEKRLYHHAYANRTAKGTHKGVFASQKMMKEVSCQGYYMQCDVSSYFTSIDKNIAHKIVNFHIDKINIPDNQKQFLSNTFKNIIFTNPELNHIKTGSFELEKLIRDKKKLGYNGKDIGLPIGSLSSQFISLLYLNELDYYIKNKLKIKNYIRYVDDFVIFDKNSKNFKSQRDDINSFLQEELKLTLNPKKTKIQQFYKGLDFLGYVIYPTHINIRKRNIKMLKAKLKYANLWLEGKRTQARKIKMPDTTDLWKLSPTNYNEFQVFKFYILQLLNSYYGNFSIVNTYNLRRNIYENNMNLLKEFLVPVNSFTKFIIKPEPTLLRRCA